MTIRLTQNYLVTGNEKKYAVEKEGKILSFDG